MKSNNFSDILVEGIAIADPQLAQQYANAQKQLNDKDAQINALQKQINTLQVTKTQIQKAMVAIEQKAAQGTVQTPTTPTTTAQPAQQNTQPAQTSTITNQANNVSSSNPTKESFNSDILKVNRLDESKFDISFAEPDELESVKNFMDSESISYKEPTANTIEFDETKLDPEWRSMLTDVGIKKLEDFQPEIKEISDDIEDLDTDSDGWQDDEGNWHYGDEPELTPEEHEQIDEDKVFYVQVEDEGDAFIGKIYKLKDDDEWLSKITVGESETFDKLYYESEWDEVDIIAFLRDNYADTTLISKDDFNEHVLDNKEEIQEALKTKGKYIISKLEDYKGGKLIK